MARCGGAGIPREVVVSTIEDRLRDLGLSLPGPFPPHDPLDAIVVHGGRARTSGQLPRDHDGRLVHPGVLGAGLSVDEGAEAARWCALNALSVLRAGLGTLDRISRVLTILGFVASAPGFSQQPAVVDGASRLLYDVFVEAGRHSRSAIGVAALPRGGAVEIEVEVALAD
jgi:enamine deaminase RidA (YjgF/YER057c/UK114 family)